MQHTSQTPKNRRWNRIVGTVGLYIASGWLITPAIFCHADAAPVHSADISAAARDMLRKHCLRCHSGPGSEGGDFDVLDVAGMRADGLIDDQDKADSLILTRVIDGEMPPASIRSRQPVSDSEMAALQQWIDQGAPAFASMQSRRRAELSSVLDAMLDDLRRAPAEERRFLRYFTLHHLQNNPVIESRDLSVYRAALSKAINSLSWHPRIAVPREVKLTDQAEGTGGLLYAIDLRHYQWTPQTWNLIERSYPYGVSYAASDQEELRRKQESIEELTSVSVPLMRADWFVATATRGDLYYQILDLPQNETHLLRQLGVDPQAAMANPHPESIARAGFARSGVSAQNRLVERLVGRTGMYWRSFDFGPDAGRGKLTRFPLGPPSGNPHFDRFAFRHDGGEIIFALPNQLHGYLLIDEQGDRIEVGPIHVVGDALKTAGTPAIVNAVSCFACHKHGMIDMVDTLREGSVLEGDARRQVEKLHPVRDVMNALVQRDRDDYLQALRVAIGPFVDGGDDRDAVLRADEPIGHVARQHRLVFLNLKTIAAELDIDADELLTKAGVRSVRRLGLESLFSDGVLSRAEWEATDQGVSLMQQLARQLGLTPISPL